MIEIKKGYGKLEEDFNNMQSELRRKDIRALLYQKEIDKYQLQIKEVNQ